MNYRKYLANKARAETINTQPSATDQSQAEDTDVNVIVARYATTGQAPGAGKSPLPPADYTGMPRDLREMIETARSLKRHMEALPPQLRNLGPEQLLALTPEQLGQLTKTEEPKPKEDETK